ncbi:MAG: septum site-determining protein MinC [Hespellia sp.]|nr:septum site-determining protein MinC [Hespellia sp.]
MEQLVTIRSNKYGIEVYLNPEVSFDILLQAVRQKFQDASKFFRGAKMVTSFVGRTLTHGEETQILNTITDTTDIEIICIVEKNEKNELTCKNIMETYLSEKEKQDGQFYKGTLKKRQTLESDTSVIILGDVEPGAKVIAKGNVVVIGTIMGSVHAGATGNSDAFIVALSMHPKKLRIHDVEAKTSLIYQENASISGPKIASLDGHRIYIDPLTE